MTEHRIEPHRVTKPIQLLAAWLVGLIVTNGIFLAVALKLEPGAWERSALVISAIANVPLFLMALFVLQTRFRAELQEDTFYSEYLSKKTATVVRIDKAPAQDLRFEESGKHVIRATGKNVLGGHTSNENSDALDWTSWRLALNELHPNFPAIREALRSADIPVSEVFGNTEHPPKLWIVSISYHIPARHKAHLLTVLLRFGFDGVQFWEPQREAEESEDVYIGSYGESNYARITPELNDLLTKSVEQIDFSLYQRHHEVEFPPHLKSY